MLGAKTTQRVCREIMITVSLIGTQHQAAWWLPASSFVLDLLKRSPLDNPSDRLDSAISLATAILVELTGIEPVTSCLQSRRSPN